MMQMSAVDNLNECEFVKPKPLSLQTGGPQPPQTAPATGPSGKLMKTPAPPTGTVHLNSTFIASPTICKYY